MLQAMRDLEAIASELRLSRCRDSTLTTEQWWQHETKYACGWRADPIFLASCGPTL
jgi:hypothetical protein